DRVRGGAGAGALAALVRSNSHPDGQVPACRRHGPGARSVARRDHSARGKHTVGGNRADHLGRFGGSGGADGSRERRLQSARPAQLRKETAAGYWTDVRGGGAGGISPGAHGGGPRVRQMAGGKAGLGGVFVALWPYLRWG